MLNACDLLVVFDIQSILTSHGNATSWLNVYRIALWHNNGTFVYIGLLSKVTTVAQWIFRI